MGALTPDGLDVMVEDAEFRRHETLGVSPNTDAATLRRAMTRLAMLYHPDKGGRPEQTIRVNAAYERASKERPLSNRRGTSRASADARMTHEHYPALGQDPVALSKKDWPSVRDSSTSRAA
jgi:hypothetical protein